MSEHEEVRLTSATIEHLQAKMQEAVSRGIREAMTEEAAEQFWAAGMRMLQRNAAERTGLWMGGMVMTLVRKGALFVALGALVYSVGGWSALAALAKTLTSTGGNP